LSVFPNIIKIVVVSQCDKVVSEYSHEIELILIKEILQSTNSSRIEELAVRNFDLSSQTVNYLREALKEVQSEFGLQYWGKQRIPIHRMRNVKTIRLEQNSNESDKLSKWRASLEDLGYCSESSFDFEQLDLETVLHHYPNLRILYVSRIMFGSCSQLARSQYIDQLAEQYPKVSIVLV